MVAAVAVVVFGVAGCVAVPDETAEELIELVAPSLPEPEVVEPEPPRFDLGLYPIDEADSLWVVVNKLRPLDPIDYAPVDLVAPDVPSAFDPLLRREAADAVEALYIEATAAGVPFRIQSTYRSYTTQQRVKANSVSRLGQAVSDERSARPGHSEHQTGLAVDFTTNSGACTLEACFADTPEGAWLAENAWRFGLIVRYLEGKSDVHGYVYEPWHFRYVGTELAEWLHLQGNPTLEEVFGLDPAPAYSNPPSDTLPAPQAPSPPLGETTDPAPNDGTPPARPGEAGQPDFPDDPEG